MPPRKRALKAVPDPPEEIKPYKLGKNKAHYAAQQEHHLGPDMPPGLYKDYLPTEAEIPPKPRTEPQMAFPGPGHSRKGNPEWQLYTTFDPGDPFKAISREWRVRWVPQDDRRCVARGIGKTSAWQGNRCTQMKIKGANVCRFHGGALPNVKKAAQARLAMAALPAAEELINIALKKKGVSDADRIKAIIQILDRAGVEGKQTIQVELSLWQRTLQSVYAHNLAAEGEELPGRELEEGVDYVLEDDEEADDGSGE